MAALLLAAPSTQAQTCPYLQLICSNTNILCGTPIPTTPPPYDDPCCDLVTVTLLSSTTTNYGCTQVVSQVWQAVDECYSLTNTCTRTVTVLPSTPMLLCHDLNILCGTPIPTNPPDYFDPCCTNVIVRLIRAVTNSPPGGCSLNVLQFWSAVDQCCGTSNICQRTITAMPSPPTLLCTNLILPFCSFGYSNPPPYIDVCCTNVVVSLLGSLVSTSGCFITVTQTWQALDLCCGLSSVCMRTITAPTPTTPTLLCSDITTTCGAPFPPPPIAFDVCCPAVSLSLLKSVTNFFPGSCGLVVTQSWSVTNLCCGGSNFCLRTVTIMPAPPTLLCSNLSLACGDFSYTNAPPFVDSCCTNVGVMLLSSVTSSLSPCSVVITQTWSAMDLCCRLATTCTRTISITSAPAFLCKDLDLLCGDFSFTNPPAYMDLCCPDVSVTLLPPITSTITGCTTIMTQTWMAVDHCCGSASTCTRTVTITIPPPILLCTNLVVECGDTNLITPPAYLASCCTNVMVTLETSTFSGSPPCSGVVTQTWKAVDLCCGGSNTCTRTVTMRDTTPPTITCPANMTVTTCGTNAIVTWTVAATDNCALGGISSSPPSGSSFLPNTTNTVTCTAWDRCNNTNTCTFKIKVTRPTLGLLTVTNVDGLITVNWADGILQQADSILGPWTDVSLAAPPSYSTPASAAANFYRLRCTAP